jgi:hypothetical protein
MSNDPGESAVSLDPTLLNIKSSNLSALTEEQLCTLLQVKSFAALKYPVFLHFDNKRFQLQTIDFLASMPDVVKQLRNAKKRKKPMLLYRIDLFFFSHFFFFFFFFFSLSESI